MLFERFRTDCSRLALARHMRIKPGVVSLGYESAEIRQPAADVEDARPGRNGPGRHGKLLAQEGLRKKPETYELGIKLIVECAVSFARRVKKIKSRRRFP